MSGVRSNPSVNFTANGKNASGRKLQGRNMKQRKPKTIAEYEALGAQIEKDPLRYSILYQLEVLRLWQPQAEQKAN
jgi:hypothetical protein